MGSSGFVRCALMAFSTALVLPSASSGCDLVGPVESTGGSSNLCPTCSDSGDATIGVGGTWAAYDSGSDAAEGSNEAASDADTSDGDGGCVPDAGCVDSSKSCRSTCLLALNNCVYLVCGGDAYCILVCQNNYNACVANCVSACMACAGDAGCAAAPCQS